MDTVEVGISPTLKRQKPKAKTDDAGSKPAATDRTIAVSQ
jgi:hypothetical protein